MRRIAERLNNDLMDRHHFGDAGFAGTNVRGHPSLRDFDINSRPMLPLWNH